MAVEIEPPRGKSILMDHLNVGSSSCARRQLRPPKKDLSQRYAALMAEAADMYSLSMSAPGHKQYHIALHAAVAHADGIKELMCEAPAGTPGPFTDSE